MSDKEKYLIALQNSNEQLDNITLGESIGFTSVKTTQIIEKLLNEGKIKFKSLGLFSYRGRQ